jgi:DNA helicase-2/ATP-dependent DNA helicase PcrA
MIEDISLQSDQDTLGQSRQNQNSVKLMMVHASKGLEFEYVFIVGLEAGLFPHQRDLAQTGEESEEERRLFYVALTRAKQKLFLSYANTRTIFGERRTQLPSEFLSDIPDSTLEWKESEYFEKKSDNFDDEVYID